MIKRVIQSNALWAVIAVLVNVAINFLIVPYMTENVGVAAYGFVTLGNTLITYVDIISLALNSFASRFIAIEYHRGQIDEANKYYSSILVANLVLSFALLLIGVPLIFNLSNILVISAHLVPDVKFFFGLVLIRYVFILLRNAFDVSTFIKNRLDLTEKFRTISYLIQAFSLLLLCMIFPAHIWYVGMASLLAALFLFLAQVLATRSYTPDLKFRFREFSFKTVGTLISAGIWNSINSLGNLLNNGLDLVIANQMLGSVAMGMISVSETLGSLCYTVITAISNAFRPNQLKSYSSGDMETLRIQLLSAMRTTGLFCSLIIAGFAACGLDFVHLWLPSQNQQEIFALSLIVLIGTVITGVVNPLYFVFTLTNKLIIPCLITIGMGILNVVGMIVLIKFTSAGALGVVLTTAVLNLIHFVDTPIYAAYVLKMPFKTFYPAIAKHLLNVAALLLATLTVNTFYPKVSSWIQLMVKIILFAILESALSAVLLTTVKEKKIALNKILK